MCVLYVRGVEVKSERKVGSSKIMLRHVNRHEFYFRRRKKSKSLRDNVNLHEISNVCFMLLLDVESRLLKHLHKAR